MLNQADVLQELGAKASTSFVSQVMTYAGIFNYTPIVQSVLNFKNPELAKQLSPYLSYCVPAVALLRFIAGYATIGSLLPGVAMLLNNSHVQKWVVPEAGQIAQLLASLYNLGLLNIYTALICGLVWAGHQVYQKHGAQVGMQLFVAFQTGTLSDTLYKLIMSTFPIQGIVDYFSSGSVSVSAGLKLGSFSELSKIIQPLLPANCANLSFEKIGMSTALSFDSQGNKCSLLLTPAAQGAMEIYFGDKIVPVELALAVNAAVAASVSKKSVSVAKIYDEKLFGQICAICHKEGYVLELGNDEQLKWYKKLSTRPAALDQSKKLHGVLPAPAAPKTANSGMGGMPDLSKMPPEQQALLQKMVANGGPKP